MQIVYCTYYKIKNGYYFYQVFKLCNKANQNTILSKIVHIICG